jgi:hypothetical protein
MLVHKVLNNYYALKNDCILHTKAPAYTVRSISGCFCNLYNPVFSCHKPIFIKWSSENLFTPLRFQTFLRRLQRYAFFYKNKKNDLS